ncbi:histone deacetylase family protein [Roseomonas elaeocarpi]|uniref:Histone deacetylase family protein n=1 Tax=Roseomonas elaeocarpi TaxID=907779 RepID=A0ABV6JV10_9PROT
MSVLLLTHRACLGHDMGPEAPECPERLRRVVEALEAQKFSTLLREEAPLATREQLLRVHTPDHVETLLSLHPGPGETIRLDPDTAVGEHSTEAALRAAGAGVAAVDAVLAGGVRRAFCAVRPPGHHAEPAQAMGFCLFGNAAVAVRHAQQVHGLRRVALLDFDVHHGNGSQAAFGNDPGVFFASTHQMPLYPGTGAAEERGCGNIWNLPLAPGSRSEAFHQAWEGTILPELRRFAPELIVISAGFDAHARDPLAQLRLEEEDFRRVTAAICEVAREVCGGRVVSLLEGGYDLAALARSVATHVQALMDA